MSGKPTNKGQETRELTSSFTVDQEGTSAEEMPGVTRLLNRKSFSKSSSSISTSTPDGPTVMMPPEEAPLSIPISISDAAPAASKTVQKPSKRRKTDAKPLVSWDLAELKAGTDPLAKALAALIDGGVSQALFLGIQQAQKDGLPVFVASAAVNAGQKSSLWSGLRWDPAILPEIWTQLMNTGFVELPPPGTMTNLHSARNVSRAAFDISNEESLALARVGTAQQFRGILVLVSRKSLLASVKRALPLLSMVPAPIKKTA